MTGHLNIVGGTGITATTECWNRYTHDLPLLTLAVSAGTYGSQLCSSKNYSRCSEVRLTRRY